ncbi:MAG: two-component system sensor histidine kinase NtrB [Chitinophagales bacterium]
MSLTPRALGRDITRSQALTVLSGALVVLLFAWSAAVSARQILLLLLFACLWSLGVWMVNRRTLRRVRRNLERLSLVGPASDPCPDFDYEEFRTVAQANATAFAEACRLESQHRQMLDSCPWGYAIFDATGWPAVLGSSGAAILGHAAGDIPQLRDLIQKVLREEVRLEQELTLSLPHGIRVLHFSVFPTVLDSGGPGVMVWFLDLSKQRQAQTIIHHRDRLSVLGELASVIAHDVRNPLTTIKALAQLGQHFPGQVEPGQAWGSVERAVDEVVEYLESVLAFCRPGRGTLAPCPVQQLFTKIKLMVQSRTDYHGIKVETFLADPDLTLMVNPLDVQHALLNLVLNAVEAISSSGKGSRILLEAEAQDGVARLRVRNDGPGIPADQLERIWEMFYTTKAAGSGIGLAVVKKVAETHGGSVDVASDPSGGTVFELQLPLRPPKDPSA